MEGARPPEDVGEDIFLRRGRERGREGGREGMRVKKAHECAVPSHGGGGLRWKGGRQGSKEKK
jgi:hypothetical protein